jgi:SLOG in TRPM
VPPILRSLSRPSFFHQKSEKGHTQQKKIELRKGLEQHHTHFILVDDGTLNPSDKVADQYRSKLAKSISTDAYRKSKKYIIFLLTIYKIQHIF